MNQLPGAPGAPQRHNGDGGERQPINPVIPLVLAVAMFMEQMDSTVIATSLAAIAADIDTEPVALKLALTSYLLALAIFIPVSGWIADRFGARVVYRWAILVFVLGSIACAFSDSLFAFVLSRFVQGMGGALMTPVGRLVLVRLTPKSQLVVAMSWLSMPALIGPITGPPLGGFITTYFSWHWIFIINVPIGLLGIVLATRFLPRTGYRDQRRIDTRGFVLAAIAFSGVVFGLSVISLPALPPVYGIATLAAGLGASAAYVWHARRTPDPLLDPRILKNKLFAITLWGGSLFRIGVGAFGFLAPLMLQLCFGYSPFEAGMITFVTAVGAIIVKIIIAPLLGRFGYRPLLLFAAIASALSVAAMGVLPLGTPAAVFLAVLLAGGFVRSVYFTADSSLIYAAVEEADMSQATAIISVTQQLTIALGVALAGIVLELGANVTDQGLDLQTFQVTFLTMGVLTALAFFWILALPRDAGAEVSGHSLPPVH